MDTLSGKTMGFVGFGNIATATAALALPFGMRLLALRRRKPEAQAGVKSIVAATYGVEDAAAFYRWIYP